MICSLNQLTNAEMIHRNLNALFNHSAFPSGNQNYPMLNVFESSETITINAELPGVTKDDVSIKLENGVLTLTGTRKVPEYSDETTILRKERAGGKFEKSLKIPMRVNDAGVTANLKDGILTIVLPKSIEARPKTIEIN